jgi:maltooligosyltrehalose trehalohydrolase
MGQEWAASTPFLYFTDHHAELGRLVTEGRRAEFRHFAAFSDPAARERIPDPQAPATFEASRLTWRERVDEPHAATLRLYQALLALRRTEPSLRHGEPFEVVALDHATIAMRRGAPGREIVIVVRLRDAGTVDLSVGWRDRAAVTRLTGDEWRVVLTSEDAAFSDAAAQPVVARADGRMDVQFAGPSAVVLQRMPSRP